MGVGAVKAAPTIALSEAGVGSVSPEESGARAIEREREESEGMGKGQGRDEGKVDALSNLVQHSRRRTTSYHAPRVSDATAGVGVEGGGSGGLTASGTLASLASSWGVSFGRKRKSGPPNQQGRGLVSPVETDMNGSGSG